MGKSKIKLLVKDSALRVVQLEDIQTDHSYQRDIKSKYKKIVANFKQEAFGIPVLGQRKDGTIWVVDGLQRITAIRAMGRTSVRAEVFASSGPEYEAEIFVAINGNRTKTKAAEEFKAMLTSGDPLALSVYEVCTASGYKVSTGGKAGDKSARMLTCVGLLVEQVKINGAESLKFALDMIQQSWPDDKFGIYNLIIGGLIRFYVQREGVIDTERLLSRLRTTNPHRVIYNVQQMGIGAGRYDLAADLFGRMYDKRASRAKS